MGSLVAAVGFSFVVFGFASAKWLSNEEDLATRLADAQRQRDELNTQLTSLQKRFQNDMIDMEAQVKCINTENAELKSIVKDQKAELKWLRSDQGTLINGIQNSKDEITILKKEKAEALTANSKQLETHNDYTTQLQAEINRLNTALDTSAAENKLLTESKARLESHHQNLITRHHAARRESLDQGLRLRTAEREAQSAKDREQRMRSHFILRTAQHNDALAQIRTLTTTLREARAANDTLQTRFDVLETAYNTLDARINEHVDLQRANAELEASAEGFVARVQMLEGELYAERGVSAWLHETAVRHQGEAWELSRRVVREMEERLVEVEEKERERRGRRRAEEDRLVLLEERERERRRRMRAEECIRTMKRILGVGQGEGEDQNQNGGQNQNQNQNQNQDGGQNQHQNLNQDQDEEEDESENENEWEDEETVVGDGERSDDSDMTN